MNAPRNPWLLVGPAIALLIVLAVLPLIRLVVESLFRRSLTSPEDTSFAGVGNYLDIVTSRQWWLAVALTLVVVTIAVIVQLLLAAAFAGTLRRITIGGPWVQVFLLAPFVLGPVVTATVWRDAWANGFVPVWLHANVGGGQLAGLATVLSHEIWRGTGITTVILLAGLSQVKPSLLDSAIADGATAWQRLNLVVLPAVAPAVGVAALFRSLDALRSIEAPILAADSLGQLATATQLVWNTNFNSFELGLGAAMSIVLLLVAAGLGFLLTLVLRVRRAI
jgi:multiple sugar transport system permease protein